MKEFAMNYSGLISTVILMLVTSLISYFKGKKNVSSATLGVAEELDGIGGQLTTAVTEIIDIVTKSEEIQSTESLLLEKLKDLNLINTDKVGSIKESVSKIHQVSKIGAKLKAAGFNKSKK